MLNKYPVGGFRFAVFARKKIGAGRPKHKKRFSGLGMILLFLLSGSAALFSACGVNEQAPAVRAGQKDLPDSSPAAAPEARDYQKSLAAVAEERAALAARYRQNGPDAAAVEKARRELVRSIDERIIPFWYETEWDFYGTTETPRTGKIACGYFVTTVLRDAGLKVERGKLAQQPSERIILSLTDEAFVKRFRRATLEEFVGAIEKWGEGLYIVGLDFHVGFIVNDGEKTYFIHASYAEPRKVIREIAADSEVLASSKYRIVGRISADDNLVAKWLRQEKIPTR